ncbi:hypothetical protein NX059_004643 [Plenodomus lindquistii]|nr:hypothetical protein NX059_004643 [Plenodomus lindquistii]
MLDAKDPAPHEVEEAREISKLVDGLPVYLSHISGHISQTQSTLAEYLRSVNRSSSIWTSRQHPGNWMYERTIDTMFDVALNELSPAARRLLYVLSFLNPDGVAEKIIFPDAERQGLEFLQFDTEDSFLEAIADLRQRQLVTRERPRGISQEGRILTMHRSLQEGIQHKLSRDPAERSGAFLCALNSLRRLIPRPTLLVQAEPQKWEKMRAHLPQLLSLRRAYARSDPRIPGVLDFAGVLFDVGMNMWDRGLTTDGKAVLLTAEEVLDSINYDEMGLLRANINVVLGVILDDIGISGRSEALERCKKALLIRQSYFDKKKDDERTFEDDVLLHAALNDLCGSYRQINNFAAVREISERLYAKYMTWGDVDKIPYEYAKYYNNMSFERAYYGDQEGAEGYSKRAWILMGKNASFALHSSYYKVTWALRLYRQGKLERAIGELLLILNFRLQTVGRQSYVTLQTELALGILYLHVKDYQKSMYVTWETTGLGVHWNTNASLGAT